MSIQRVFDLISEDYVDDEEPGYFPSLDVEFVEGDLGEAELILDFEDGRKEVYDVTVSLKQVIEAEVEDE